MIFLKAAIIRARSSKILPTPGGSSCQRAQAFSPERHMVGGQRERHGIVRVGVNPGAEGDALAGSPRAAGLAARPLGDGVPLSSQHHQESRRHREHRPRRGRADVRERAADFGAHGAAPRKPAGARREAPRAPGRTFRFFASQSGACPSRSFPCAKSQAASLRRAPLSRARRVAVCGGGPGSPRERWSRGPEPVARAGWCRVSEHGGRPRVVSPGLTSRATSLRAAGRPRGPRGRALFPVQPPGGGAEREAAGRRGPEGLRVREERAAGGSEVTVSVAGESGGRAGRSGARALPSSLFPGCSRSVPKCPLGRRSVSAACWVPGRRDLWGHAAHRRTPSPRGRQADSVWGGSWPRGQRRVLADGNTALGGWTDPPRGPLPTALSESFAVS